MVVHREFDSAHSPGGQLIAEVFRHFGWSKVGLVLLFVGQVHDVSEGKQENTQ